MPGTRKRQGLRLALQVRPELQVLCGSRPSDTVSVSLPASDKFKWTRRLMESRIHQYSPAFEQRDDLDTRQRPTDFATKTAEVAEFYRKWTLLWRSITLSSLDGDITYKPYCRYIKTLDFRNLST